MKKLVICLIAWFCLCLPSFASNSATELYTLPNDPLHPGPIHVVKVAIDTVDEDLTVYDPASGNRVYVVGVFMSETDATNITFKSGSTSVNVAELAANQGIYDKVNGGYIIGTKKDDNFVIQASVAISSIVFYVVETAGHY